MQLNLHGQWISTSKWAGKHCLLFFHWLFDFIVQFIIVLDRGMHLLLDHSAICIMLASVADYASLFFSVLDNCQEILCWVFSLFFLLIQRPVCYAKSNSWHVKFQTLPVRCHCYLAPVAAVVWMERYCAGLKAWLIPTLFPCFIFNSRIRPCAILQFDKCTSC